MSEDYRFFYPNETQTQMADKEEFINYYNTRYFTYCTDKVPYTTAKGKSRSVGKNSKFAEELIEKILEKNPEDFTDSDVALILAWKIGKIKHSESENQKLVLHRDWQKILGKYSSDSLKFKKWEDKPKPIKRYKNIDIDVKTIAKYLRKDGERLNELVRSGQRQEALNELREENWQGIGSVYLITLLYFVSNHQYPGKCPIYDRFAMRALLAIKDNKKIGESVECGELPDKSSKQFSEVVDKRMNEYIELLEDIFGDEYKDKRDIDRALWVYGHLFKDSAAGKVIIN